MIRQDNKDDLNWDRRHSKTPSGDRHEKYINNQNYPVTGPTRAAQGNYYIYLETSMGRADQVARLIITDGMLGRRVGAYCMKFSYSMNGFHSGRKHDIYIYIYMYYYDNNIIYKYLLILLHINNLYNTKVINIMLQVV